jgi:YegS/Rv2252/BmrU family lipid kinase
VNGIPPGGSLHLIVNPIAGGGRARAALPAIESALESRGVPFRTHRTDAPGAAHRIALDLPQLEPIVGLGGDGTLHEIVGALLSGGTRSERALGVLPFGTGNDFAREIGLRPLDLEAGLRAILNGRTRDLDAGVLNGQPFLNGVGSGFDAQVARTVGGTPRWLPGPARYLLAILAELMRLEARSARVTVDGLVVHDGESLLVATMNLPCYGGGLRIAPRARGDDARLEVVIGKRFSRLGALGILPRLARGTHVGHAQVEVFSGREVRIEWATPNDAHADGELMPATRTLEVRVLPGALRVIVPS